MLINMKPAHPLNIDCKRTYYLKPIIVGPGLSKVKRLISQSCILSEPSNFSSTSTSLFPTSCFCLVVLFKFSTTACPTLWLFYNLTFTNMDTPN